MLSPKLITGIILAGGKSSRFGSNKALANYKNTTILEHTYNTLQPFCRSIIISGEYSEYKNLKIKTQADLIPNIGPLGGIYSCLINSGTPWLLIITCDMPLINEKVLSKLITNEYHNLVIHKIEDDLQLFPMLIANNQQNIAAIENNIQNKKYAIRHLLNRMQAHVIPVKKEDESLFKNINYLKDYITLNTI